jgi:hypothetical protein
LKLTEVKNTIVLSDFAPTGSWAWWFASERTKQRYYQKAAEFALMVKRQEIAKGLDKNGRRLAPISQYTMENRYSEMTPYADPYAPPLIPGHGLSRTSSLLKSRVYLGAVILSWTYDAHTGGPWSRILRYHADSPKKRDVFGISPRGRAKIQEMLDKYWAGQYLALPEAEEFSQSPGIQAPGFGRRFGIAAKPKKPLKAPWKVSTFYVSPEESGGTMHSGPTEKIKWASGFGSRLR